MKALHIGIAVLFLLMINLSVSAQAPTKQRETFFRNVSDRLPAAVTELDKAFSAKKGTAVSFKFYNMLFNGTVISSANKPGGIQSVVIASADLKNTILSLSKRTNDNKTTVYTGRIINQNASDGYVLTENQDGTYTFHKIRTEDLIQDY